MKLSAPKVATFWVGVALLVLGLLGSLNVVNALAAYDFWLAFLGGVVLAAGAYIKGL